MLRSSRLKTLLLTATAALALSACSSTGSNTAASRDDNLSIAGERIDGAFKKDLAAAEKTGNPQTVIAVMEPYFRRHADNPVLAARYARALREDNQLNSSRNVLIPFTKGEDAHPEALTEMAMTQLSLGNYKEAELAARAATKLDKNAGRAHLALGTALDAQGNYPAAEESFRTGLKVWRGDAAPILNNLALNLASQGNFEQALDILDRARKEYPHRTELERNYRIISTLYATEQHTTDQKPNFKKQAAAPAPAVKKEEIEPAAGKPAAPVKKDKVVEKAEEKARQATKKTND